MFGISVKNYFTCLFFIFLARFGSSGPLNKKRSVEFIEYDAVSKLRANLNVFKNVIFVKLFFMLSSISAKRI